MKEDLKIFVKRCLNVELKWMYHYDVDDELFGVATDKYRWCKRLLDGECTVEMVIEYFKEYYPNDEAGFIEKLSN